MRGMTGLRRYFRRRIALTLPIVLVAALVGATPAAASEPRPGTGPGGIGAAGTGGAALPAISPTPRSERALGPGFALPGSADIVTGDFTDAATLDVLRTALRDAGVRRITESARPTRTGGGLVVDIGTAAENPQTSGALADLRVDDANGLAAQGYVLATGLADRGRGGRIVLQGVDDVGVFYAAQSLRQVLADPRRPHHVPGVAVRDWPSFAARGGMQSFYGPAWTTAEQVRQLKFLAANKMNTYFYGVAGDVHTDRDWSEPYSAADLASFRTVVAAADRLHINFIYRISPEDPLDPGAGICHSSPTDRQELIARLQQMWDVGVRSFTIAWDDVAGTFTCEGDRQEYGHDASPAAAAQASIVDFVQQQFIRTHAGANPLMTVPTEYWGDQSDTYRSQFDSLTDPAVQIFWTGPAVVSQSIAATDIQAAQRAFPRHRLLVWDNYPVNDFDADRLFLGPLAGRSSDLDRYTSTIMFNEMQEEAPSEIPLFTEADYAWNSASYDPQTSWARAVRAIGGRAWRALESFAVNNASSSLADIQPSGLVGAIESFEAAYRTGKDVRRPALALRRAFDDLSALPGRLRTELHDPALLAAIAPWLDKLGDDGTVGARTVDELVAQAEGRNQKSWDQRLAAQAGEALLDAIPQQIASAGAFAGFRSFARAQNDGAIGTTWYRGLGPVTATPGPAAGTTAAAAADGNPDTAYTAAGATTAGDGITVPFGAAHTVTSVVILQGAKAESGTVQLLVDGAWRSIGSTTRSYAQVDAMGVQATAVRVLWVAGDAAPTVYEISPHYSDVPAATVSVTGSSRLVAVGRTTTVPVTITAFAPRPTTGVLAVEPPAGWVASPPTQGVAVVGRNRVMTTTASVDVAVPEQAAMSTFTVPVTFTLGPAELRDDLTMTTGRVSTEPYQGMVTALGPSAFWPLDDTTATVAHDLGDHGHDGAYVDGAGVGAPGPMGQAAADLAAGYIDVPRDGGLVPPGAFTIEAWIKLDAVAPAPGQAIVESYSTPAASGFALRVDAGRLQGWTMSARSANVVTGPATVTAGTWNYVAEVFDGSTLSIYLDGLPDGSVASTAAPGSGTASVKLGARGDDAGQRLDGDLADVAIYPAALTPQQIATHYLTGTNP